MSVTSMEQPGANRPGNQSVAQGWAVAVAAAALSATGAPTPKTLARLTEQGLDAGAAGLLLHVAPVVLALAAWGGMRVLARGRGPMARMGLYAGAGGIVGFVTAFCLDLFVGVIPALERLTGPLRDTGGIDIAAWSLCAFSLFYGVVMLSIAAFGTPAMRAIAMENVDPECTDVRSKDRGTFAVSAAGLLGQGVFVGALAIAHQLGADASSLTRVGIAGAVALGAGVFIWSSWVLWRGFDEMQRRVTIEAYAWSGLIAWLACLVWSVLESLSLAAPMTAYTAIIALVALQTAAALAVTAHASLPATRKARAA